MKLSYDSGPTWEAAQSLFENHLAPLDGDDLLIVAEHYTDEEIVEQRRNIHAIL
jgi:hypothetical protein